MESVSRTLWETALWDKGAEQNWHNLKEVFHRVQEPLMFICKKSRKEGKRLVKLSEGLLVRLMGKKEKEVEAGTGLLGRV